MSGPVLDGRAVAIVVAVLSGLCAALLVLPGQTATSVYINDLFIFLEGAHRILSGQVPNRDFHTPLGPLVFYAPAAGLALTGSLGLAMPVAMALWLAALAPPMAWLLGSRVRPALAIPFAAFLVLAAAMPANLGESVSALSFAMSYNRLGWIALALVAVAALAPGRPGRGAAVADAACLTWLTGLLLYSKASYGLVALGLVGLLVLFPARRLPALLALAGILLAGLAIEAAWGGTMAHVADIRLAGAVSGKLLGNPADFVDVVLRNTADFVLLALAGGLHVARTRDPRVTLLHLYLAGAGAAIMTQNYQSWGVLTLHAGILVAAESLMRLPPRDGSGSIADRFTPVAGMPLLVLAVTLPTVVQAGATLGWHAVLAAERPVSRYALPAFDRIRVAELWPVNDFAFATRFREGIADGAAALVELQASRVVVLDFVNPFSAGLGLAPPRGDSAWLHWGRNLDQRHPIPAGDLLADARFVLSPKPGVNGPQLWEIYGGAVEAAFDLVRETPHWRVYRRRPPPATAGGGAGDPG